MASSVSVMQLPEVTLNQRAPIDHSPAAGKSTRRGQFLADMERILPWAELESAVQQCCEPHAVQVGCAPGARRMLRVFLLQHWFNLSDAALEDTLHDSAAMRQFARLDDSAEPVPDERTIGAFRKLLTRHAIGEEILATVRRQLRSHGLTIKESLAEMPRARDLQVLPAPDPQHVAADPYAFVQPAKSSSVTVCLAETTSDSGPPASPCLPSHPAAVELALAALGVGVFEYDPRTGLHRFSDRCREIWGLTAEDEPKQELLLELVHPEDRHLADAMCASLKPDGPDSFEFELRVTRVDGALRWVHISGRTVFTDGPSGPQARTYGTMLDLTELRMTERKLYELDSQLSTFINGAPASIATFDCEMRFLEVSRQYAEDRGLTPAELIGRCLYEVFPNFPERWRAVHARCLKGASERCDLDVFVRANGSREWVSWEVRPWYGADHTVGGLVLVSEVITQRMRAQRRLHDSEARLELAIRAGALGIYDYDLQEETTSWDARVRELWGVEPTEQITYETFLSGLHPEDRDRTVELLNESLGPDSQGTHAAEYRVVNRRDGSIRWISSTGTVFFDRGRATRMVGIVQDITDRKQAELALAQSAAELRHADERKDAFLATLSHELRNPLAPIRTAAQILAAPNLKHEQLAWARQVIQRQTGHMASLLDDLLDVARITRGKLVLKKERVRLKSIVDSAVEAARPLLDEKHHRLVLTLPSQDPVSLVADPLRLSQVLSNLLGNAAKYTDAGGQVELRAWMDGSTLCLAVKDNGIGIPREALAQIFTMFWQVESGAEHAEGGLGIGLAFVKSLVELHGGTIEARSDGPGSGSEFIVRLPFAAAAAPPVPAARVEPVVNGAGGCRVLLADDNKDAADSLAMLLTLSHHEVRIAHCGRAALAVAETFRPDVALLDIGMPELDGYSVARALRQAPWARGMRLIALTGRGQEEDKQRACAAGFDHHLTKPINPAALERLLSPSP